jgi:hypothetical protein
LVEEFNYPNQKFIFRSRPWVDLTPKPLEKSP